MKAIVETGIKKIEIQELPMPEIQADEVLMKIRANGLCTNDIRDYLGDTVYSFPRVGGHEFSGEIVAVGAAVNPKHFDVGDHVVKYIIPACGECDYCKTGRENLCVEVANSSTFQNPNGLSGFFGMAQYIAVKSRDLYKYPKEVPFTHSAFTEPLACVVNSVERANILYGQDVLVIGGGVMGLMHVMLAKLQGARIILSEPNEERRKLAEQLGAAITFDPMAEDAVALVKQLTQGRGADVVFNTTANPIIAKQAMDFTAAGGQTFIFSSLHPNNPVPTDLGAVHSHEKVITGTVSPTIRTFYRSVQLIAKGLVDITLLLDKTFDYTQAVEAFEYAMRPETFKTIITFD
ncbi:zinc-dependent alcohol dehydrogenase [Enterococcus sp. AZ103]|uniref:zinc-dependent alcohol dehydrogenase n=1 Tax=Enterococcus sp. AZ103 TaxID=2774628 RepID=UPI003F28AD68